jgi:hypothetical protein
MPPARKSTAAETKRGRLLGGALSLTCHVLLLYALFWAWPDTSVVVEPPAVTVELVGPPAPTPSPAPKAAASPAPAAPAAPVRAPPVKPPPRRALAKPPPPDVDYLPAQVASKSDSGATLTEAQLAGATVAGSGAGAGGGGAGGGGGGPCDMAARLQSALRRDPMVRAAVGGAAGKAILVWNGDWVRSTGEDGKGLSIIREAILWEVGFAPAACRAQPVRGMVVLSLNGSGGPMRLALGEGRWRWSDLLDLHRSADAATEQ